MQFLTTFIQNVKINKLQKMYVTSQNKRLNSLIRLFVAQNLYVFKSDLRLTLSFVLQKKKTRVTFLICFIS